MTRTVGCRNEVLLPAADAFGASLLVAVVGAVGTVADVNCPGAG